MDNIKNKYETAIPEINEPEILRNENITHSEFINVGKDRKIYTAMQYPVLHMTHAVSDCFVREEVYEKLLRVQQSLPETLRLVIWDAWRPYALQEELFYAYSDKIIREFGLRNMDQEHQQQIINKYVCLPTKEKFRTPVHTTGGAVDVTLQTKDGMYLPMGTSFDEMTDKTNTSYYEKEVNEDRALTIRDNRRLLYYAMTEEGFTNLPSEWWHFDYGDRFWAYYTGNQIMYDEVYSKEDIITKQ